MQVRAYEDGKRYVVVFEDPQPETIKKIQELIATEVISNTHLIARETPDPKVNINNMNLMNGQTQPVQTQAQSQQVAQPQANPNQKVYNYINGLDIFNARSLLMRQNGTAKKYIYNKYRCSIEQIITNPNNDLNAFKQLLFELAQKGILTA